MSRTTYDTVVEYAAVLEAENLELKPNGGAGSSTVSSLPDMLVAITTTSSTTIALIAEIKRVQETQAAAHAAQIAQLTALMKAVATSTKPPPGEEHG